ncbi:MAG: HepT-like ribonuclease domain-containing protein [Rubrobacteraceae bacterium]|nr:DUF86 domain-containing protein [Rubrobacter sp.]
MGPEERVLKALEDVQDCASFIVEATEGKDLTGYRRERLFRQAIERNLEIIGEAIGRVARHDAATAGRISEHRRIIAFRNRLIHGYDLLDDELVWDTVKSEVPVLLSEVEELLRERGA